MAARSLHAVAAEFAPDVAFLDLGLPGMDGYELGAHLRELPGLAGVRLIAVTGYGQESDRRRTRDAGFHGHIVKPVDLEAIDAVLRPWSRDAILRPEPVEGPRPEPVEGRKAKSA